jgi:hypothetical protein
VGIFDARLSGKSMRWFVEQFSMIHTSTMREMVTYSKNRKTNPDKATFIRNADGIECMGYISCGHEPLLIATKVKDVTVTVDERGNQQIAWTDIPMPRFSAPTGGCD